MAKNIYVTVNTYSEDFNDPIIETVKGEIKLDRYRLENSCWSFLEEDEIKEILNHDDENLINLLELVDLDSNCYIHTVEYSGNNVESAEKRAKKIREFLENLL